MVSVRGEFTTGAGCMLVIIAAVGFKMVLRVGALAVFAFEDVFAAFLVFGVVAADRAVLLAFGVVVDACAAVFAVLLAGALRLFCARRNCAC